MTFSKLYKYFFRVLKIFFLSLFILIIVLRIVGTIADPEASRVINQLYVRGKDNIIKGAEPIAHKNGHQHALVLIHGHMETPDAWREIVEKAKDNDMFDIYAPLLPYHGKTLETASQLDNNVVFDYLQEYINALAPQYESITVVGLSYGGLQLLNLLHYKALPKNANTILYAPAVHIKTNSSVGYWSAKAYHLGFRQYCNYDLPPLLPCKYPTYESADAEGSGLIDKEISLRYRVLPAIVEMYNLDIASRNLIEKIEDKFSIIIAENDNRVDYNIIKSQCSKNPNCKFISFPSGKHVIHYGKLKDKFFDTIVELTSLGTTNNNLQRTLKKRFRVSSA